MSRKGVNMPLNSDKKWEVEDAARTLIRAQEIKADKKIMPAVKKELGRQAKAATRAMRGTKR